MTNIKSQAPTIPLPGRWTDTVRSAVLHVIALAQFAAARTRGWAANSVSRRPRRPRRPGRDSLLGSSAAETFFGPQDRGCGQSAPLSVRNSRRPGPRATGSPLLRERGRG